MSAVRWDVASFQTDSARLVVHCPYVVMSSPAACTRRAEEPRRCGARPGRTLPTLGAEPSRTLLRSSAITAHTPRGQGRCHPGAAPRLGGCGCPQVTPAVSPAHNGCGSPHNRKARSTHDGGRAFLVNALRARSHVQDG